MKLDANKVGLLTLTKILFYVDGKKILERLRPSVPPLGSYVDFGKQNPVPGKANMVIGAFFSEEDPGGPQQCAVFTESPLAIEARQLAAAAAQEQKHEPQPAPPPGS
jgi:hypothetical protein